MPKLKQNQHEYLNFSQVKFIHILFIYKYLLMFLVLLNIN